MTEPDVAAAVKALDSASSDDAPSKSSPESTGIAENPHQKKKKKHRHKNMWLTKDSSAHLPPLSGEFELNLQKNKVCFPISKECTSLKCSPTGRLLLAGFTDGTIRIFDLTNHYQQSSNRSSSDPISLRGSGGMVDSKQFQRFGAVACQIHAKGVVS